ncbi:MAG: hypothetical protein HY320_11270 [Armatimonadetes bacterium]|nr:hypothetical protein [Armatimonadota bacterium]
MALVVAACLACTTVPYLYGWSVTPPGRVFTWTPTLNGADACTYLAHIAQVVAGRVLVDDPFTSEPHPPRLLMPQVLALGWLARGTGIGPVAAYQIGRLASGTLLLLAGYWLACCLLPTGRQRRLALLLLAFSGGLSFYLEGGADLGLLPHRLRETADAVIPESNTFHSIHNLPHLSLSAALMTGIFACFLEHRRRPARGWLGLIAVQALLLVLTHPWDLVPIVAVAAAMVALEGIRRGLPTRPLAALGAVLAGAAPGGVYYAWVTATEPVYRALTRDALAVRPAWVYGGGFAPLLLLATGLVAVPGRQRRLGRLALPLLWVVAVAFFLTDAVDINGKQNRLVGGVHVALAILAAAGLDAALRSRPCRRLLACFPRPGVARAVLAGLAVLLASPSSYALIARQITWYDSGAWVAHYHPRALHAAAAWLRGHAGDGDLVLAGPQAGAWLPVLSLNRTYYGHWHFTLDRARKERALARFFFAPWAMGARKDWLRRQGIRYVLWWPGEWPLPPPPLSEPGLSERWRSAEMVLYEVGE